MRLGRLLGRQGHDGFTETFALLGGALSAIRLPFSSFPKVVEGESVMRITLGLDSPDQTNMGGDKPVVTLFDDNGDFAAQNRYCKEWPQGEARYFVLPYYFAGPHHPTYALIGARNDAICIAQMQITSADGARYSWIGDFGQLCGGHWYFSNQDIPGYPDDEGKASCMWIDKNNDFPETGFQVHWPDFSAEGEGRGVPDTLKDRIAKKDQLCHAPSFFIHYYPHILPQEIYVLDPDTGVLTVRYKDIEDPEASVLPRSLNHSTPASRRTNTAGKITTRHSNSIVMADHHAHKASELCGSPMSAGPSLVSHTEKLFCRMTDKTLWPLCDATTNDNCFNQDLMQVIAGGLTTRDSPYQHFIDWRSYSTQPFP
ncbi:hypothetical protein F5Y15DRAFT_235105 [Xylariaceae sp. FL0016]|nr:hypothetical protein F5Y15DRAFT_235105 [Xylariaceae sp. FL0016]